MVIIVVAFCFLLLREGKRQKTERVGGNNQMGSQPEEAVENKDGQFYTMVAEKLFVPTLCELLILPSEKELDYRSSAVPGSCFF